jgi:hypothetical protein
MKLNSVFLMHGALALLGAFLMLAAPVWFTQKATGVIWASGAIYDLAEDYCRLAALGGVLIALVAGLARASSSTAARLAALRSMFWISLGALAVAIVFVAFQPLLALLILFNLVFALAYKYIELFVPYEI